MFPPILWASREQDFQDLLTNCSGPPMHFPINNLILVLGDVRWFYREYRCFVEVLFHHLVSEFVYEIWGSIFVTYCSFSLWVTQRVTYRLCQSHHLPSNLLPYPPFT